MKIFSPPESSAPIERKGKGKKHAAAPQKAEVSDKEIREKLATHVETSNTAKSQFIQKNSKALGAGFMNEDGEKDSAKETAKETVKDSIKDSHLLMSDVQLNDPNDSNTQEKLKTVLRNGAFSFNPREKETLEKILAGS